MPVEQVRLAVGLVLGSHGIRGDLKVRALSDSPEQLIEIRQVFLAGDAKPRKVRSARVHGESVLLRVTGITTPEEATSFKGTTIHAAGRDVRPLDEGEYFLYQLIGLEARDEQGAVLGTVVDLIETGATDVFVIRQSGSGAETLLPNRPEVVLQIDPQRRVMIVRPLEYLD